MLTTIEKILFALAVVVSLYLTWRGVSRMIRIINRGSGKPDWQQVGKRLVSALFKAAILLPTYRLRLGASTLHAMVAWGFLYYILVNFGDLIQAYIPNFQFLGNGAIGNIYHLGADLMSVTVLVGMVSLTIRRFVFKPVNMNARESVLLHPKARFGIQRDSAIVSGFIILHVGGRFSGETFKIAAEMAETGHYNVWQPFASVVARLWSGWRLPALTVAEHLAFWFALGLILAFLPYFPYSKHIHLFMTPLNFLLKPQRHSIGELSSLNFEDDSIEQFGATRLEHLGWEQLMDAYACIMCFRCQEVCPAYTTGKVLSPAAMEINKRYFLNYEGRKVAAGEETEKTLVDFAIPKEAVWACTACAACVDICPVGNEPMRDILDIRRSLVLMDSAFPDKLQGAYRGMERTANPWNIPSTERLKWAEGLKVPTIEQNPEPDVLWWVGCAAATDARAQKTARAFAKILSTAGVNYAVLGQQEQCTGDAARRSGNEYIFNELAKANVEILNEVAPKRIVTTCPHCLHTLKNEYPAFGGNYKVVHHTQLINELMTKGILRLKADIPQQAVFHDPCYLGRQNGIFKDPRLVLEKAGVSLSELPRHAAKSFCCGAGGAQMWKEEENGTERISANRFREAEASGCPTLAVGCPFCMTMFNDASKDADSHMQVLDVAEIVADALPE